MNYIVFENSCGCELARYEVATDNFSKELYKLLAKGEPDHIYEGDIIRFVEE